MTKDVEARLQASYVQVEVERIQPLLDMGNLAAFARVRFKTDAGSIVVDGFRLVRGGKGGMFVAPPSHKKGDRWYDDVEVTEDLGKYLEGAVKKAYKDATAK